MTKRITIVGIALNLAACSSAPSRSDGRGPASVVDARGVVIKKLGPTTQVIASGVINQNADAAAHGPVAFDVLCPEEAPEIYSGGCTIINGGGATKRGPTGGVVTGLYPLVSADSGGGYRCIFDRTVKTNEISAMAFCRRGVRARARVTPPAPAAE